MSDLYITDTVDGVEHVTEEKNFFRKIDDFLVAHKKIPLKHKVSFYRLLATMVNAGLSVVKSLSILESQEKDKFMRKVYNDLIKWVKGWKTLSLIMRGYGESFSDSECSIIESGEKTGKLKHALLQLADQVESIASISKKLKGALIYPAAVVLVMIGSMGVIMTMVVPKLMEVFGYQAELGPNDPLNIEAFNRLPWATQLLIMISNVFVYYWWLMVLIFFGTVIGIYFWKRTEKGRYYYDKIMLRVPIFWMVTTKVILSKFARVLSNMLSSGISIVESLRIVSDVVGNEVYRQRIMLVRDDVKRGMKIGDSLEGDKLFPIMLTQMVKVGEETATIDTIIIKIADFYDEEVNTTINSINKLLEPIIIVLMAVMVGLVAVGIMQPIMNLADLVSQQ